MIFLLGISLRKVFGIWKMLRYFTKRSVFLLQLLQR